MPAACEERRRRHSSSVTAISFSSWQSKVALTFAFNFCTQPKVGGLKLVYPAWRASTPGLAVGDEIVCVRNHVWALPLYIGFGEASPATSCCQKYYREQKLWPRRRLKCFVATLPELILWKQLQEKYFPRRKITEQKGARRLSASLESISVCRYWCPGLSALFSKSQGQTDWQLVF